MDWIIFWTWTAQILIALAILTAPVSISLFVVCSAFERGLAKPRPKSDTLKEFH